METAGCTTVVHQTSQPLFREKPSIPAGKRSIQENILHLESSKPSEMFQSQSRNIVAAGGVNQENGFDFGGAGEVLESPKSKKNIVPVRKAGRSGRIPETQRREWVAKIS